MKKVKIGLPRRDGSDQTSKIWHHPDSETVMDVIINFCSENPTAMIYKHTVETERVNYRPNPRALPTDEPHRWSPIYDNVGTVTIYYQEKQ